MSNLEFSCWVFYFIMFKCCVCVCVQMSMHLCMLTRSQVLGEVRGAAAVSCPAWVLDLGPHERTASTLSQTPPPSWLSSNMSMHGARAEVKTTFRSQFFHHELSGIRQTWMPDLHREPLPAEPSWLSRVGWCFFLNFFNVYSYFMCIGILPKFMSVWGCQVP